MPAAPPSDPVWGFALNDSLLQSFTQQVGCTLPTATGGSVHNIFWAAFLLLILTFASIWRAHAALRVLPWCTWRSAFARLPVVIWLGVWIGLLVIYYFAAWAPLIVSCWLVGGLLAVWKPQPARTWRRQRWRNYPR